jgi:putative ABC transport system permease protein
METIMVRLRDAYPEYNRTARVELVPMHEDLVAGVQARIWILMGAVGFLLLIACANLANLLLARASDRRREIALRQALGAGRRRILRQILTESVVLSGLGGLAGLLVGFGLLRVLMVLVQGSIPRSYEVGIDPLVLAFTAAVSLVAGLTFGVLPALKASTHAPGSTLQHGAYGSTRRHWVRRALVVSEVALALVLLTGAGLLTRSFRQLQQVDPGVRTEGVLTFNIALTPARYPDVEGRVAFFRDAVARINGLPGVVSTAAISTLPVSGWGGGASFNVIGRPVPPGTEPGVAYRIVSPGYFETMELSLVRGRFLADRDRLDTPAIVVNEKLARMHFPDGDAIGQVIQLGPLDFNLHPPAPIVGIVRDVQNMGLGEETSPVAYVPHEVMPWRGAFGFTVRTALDPTSLVSAVRAEIKLMDSSLPINNLQTMEDIVATTVAPQRASMILLGIFASVALAMAAVGVFGVLSYTVKQQTREMGIRLALGAKAGDVRALVVKQGMAQVGVGIGVGSVGAFALTRLMSSMLYGISPTDPMTLGVVVVLLGGAAAMASYLPARRATRVDPMAVLRSE